MKLRLLLCFLYAFVLFRISIQLVNSFYQSNPEQTSVSPISSPDHSSCVLLFESVLEISNPQTVQFSLLFTKRLFAVALAGQYPLSISLITFC